MHVVKQNVCSTGMDQSNWGSYKLLHNILVLILTNIWYDELKLICHPWWFSTQLLPPLTPLVIAMHVVKQNVCSTGMDQSNWGSYKSYMIFLFLLLTFIEYSSARIVSKWFKCPSYFERLVWTNSESNLEISTVCAERLPPRGSNYYIHTNERRVV